MSEIQSAKEFANKLYMNKGPDIDVDKELIPQYVALIRARDKAWVELCRGAIRKTIDAYFGMGSGVCKDCELAFDDVLRELGVEQ